MPRRCICENAKDAPSTYRAPIHFHPACKHSMLKEKTTSGRKAPKLKRVPGTRGVTVVER